MKIQPVKRKILPKYPDQYAIDLDRTLLFYRPVRWARAPLAGATLTAVVALGLSGCGRAPFSSTDGEPVPPSATPEDVLEYVIMGDMPMPTPALPAEPVPLFEHGDGIGVYGCVSVAAPVFLSEEDAFAIIADELSRSGFTSGRSDMTADGVSLPVTTPWPEEDAPVKTREGALAFDMWMNDSHVQLEFVSKEDFAQWIGPNEGPTISIDQYDVKAAAQTLNEGLNAVDLDCAHGVFYDPVETGETPEWTEEMTSEQWEAAREGTEAEARACAEENLRAQVRDFIAWLSAQGVI